MRHHTLNQRDPGCRDAAKQGARLRRLGAGLLAATAVMLAASQTAVAAGTHRPNAVRWNQARVATDTAAVFTCETAAFTDFACYGPDAMRKAYGLDALIASGYDGTGQTIVIIDAYGSPTLAADLDAFDAAFGLPPPPSLKQIRMKGSKRFDYKDDNQIGWAEETSLDTQWAHAVAPGAAIVVVAAVDDSDEAILDAQNYAIEHKLGYILSESFGESEYALLQLGAAGRKILDDNEKSYRKARDLHMSVFVAAGDDGAAGYDVNDHLLPFPVANYPASSPNVTSVGGTNLYFGSLTNADPDGPYRGERVWNEPDLSLATGGGVSQYFPMPDYQKDPVGKKAPKERKNFRNYPDVAYDAGVTTGVVVYLGFLDKALGPGNNGYYVFGGTSLGVPQWAGIAAIANQKAGQPLGLLNPRLYDLGNRGKLGPLVHDITVGDNSLYGVTGYAATPGFDLSTGWGTPKAGLVQALIGAKGDK